ncbi:hypothetical protein ACTJJ7_19990 [Phyllobacterium sp. 22229]|uniref:hypothetical protein n=1 Tax=Phyllobacterium sp. 22229 TaxID=3453895 RepID=UPI003F863719
MIIKSVKNLRWVRSDRSAFDADVDTVELGVIPYTATPESPTNYGQEIWSKGLAGEYGDIADFAPPIVLPLNKPLSPEQFYGLLDGLGKLDQFATMIEAVVPTVKKMTCRNQFNNATTFIWDMVLMTEVAPKVWGDDWRTVVGPQWVSA